MAQQVFPTKGNLINTKKSLELAKLGYDLLDRKRNILVNEMMGKIDTASELRKNIKDEYKKAYFALQLANVTLGSSNINAVAVPVDDSLTVEHKSIMGVELPVLKLKRRNERAYYGLQFTNSYLDEAYMAFERVKIMTVELAELENCVCSLAQAMKKTQKRANALKNIVIPKLETTSRFITEVLDEKEREDFSRMKVVKNRIE